MKYTKRIITGLLAIFSCCSPVFSQTKIPTETRNAALRYWMAFTELKNTDVDKSTKDLMARTLIGEAAWDESHLGQIVENNKESIQIMQRATRLPECDWGLEYSLGPQTPIPFLQLSVRALDRLNTLYGMRMAAKGDRQAAIDAWLAGIQFARHVSQGQSLLGNLVAAAILRSNLHVLTATAKTGTLSDIQKRQIAKAVLAVPETGFDWGEAMSYEGVATNVAVKQFAASSNPAALYEEWNGTPPPSHFSLPKSADVAAYNKLMDEMEEALRLEPSQAQEKLKLLENSEKTLHPFFKNSFPSLIRINDTRKQIQAERQSLLEQLSAK